MPQAIDPQAAYEAFLRGNLSALARLLAEDSVWHAEGDDGIALVLAGRRDILRHLLDRPARAVTTGRRGPAPLGDRLKAYRLQDSQLAECWEHCGGLAAMIGANTGRNLVQPAATARPSPSLARDSDERARFAPSLGRRVRVLSGVRREGSLGSGR